MSKEQSTPYGGKGRKRKTSRKAILAAIAKLACLPPPQFNIDKINALMIEHHKTCELCRLIFGRKAT